MVRALVFLLALLTFTTNGSSSTVRVAPLTEISPPFGIHFGAELNSTHITITVRGPSNRWFAVGFGTTMVGSVALVRTSDPLFGMYSYYMSSLDPSGAGVNPYTSQWKQVSYTETTFVEFVAVRTLTTTVANGVNFTSNQAQLDVIFAKAQTDGLLNVGYHGPEQRKQIVSLTTSTASTTPTPGSTTTAATNKCAVGTVLSTAADLPGSSIKATFTAECATKTMTVRLDGPNDVWFGILFGTQMAQSDAIVFSKGPSGSEKLLDYFLASKLSGAVQPDSPNQQYWVELLNTGQGTRRIIEYRRNWTTPGNIQNKQWTADTLSFPIMWAKGSTTDVDPKVVHQHSSTNRASGATTIDLYTGSVSTAETTVSMANLIHALCMFSAFGLFAPCGVWASLFRRNFMNEDAWYYIHRCVMPLAVIASLAGLVQAILMVITSGSGHFNSLHDLVGLFIVIIVVLQPINAVLRPKHEDHEDKECDRIIWELFHKSLGYLAVLGAQYEMYLGVNLLPQMQPTLLILYFVYEGLLVLAICGGIYFACRSSDQKMALASSDVGATSIQIAPYTGTREAAGTTVEYV